MDNFIIQVYEYEFFERKIALIKDSNNLGLRVRGYLSAELLTECHYNSFASCVEGWESASTSCKSLTTVIM